MPTPTTQQDALELTEMVVEQGLASPQQVQQCLELWQARVGENGGRGLGDLLIRSGILTEFQLQRLSKQRAERQDARREIPGFELLGEIGSGAMATVYKARSSGGGDLVAIKVLPHRTAGDVQAADRFAAESRAALRLNHPNMVRAYDVRQEGDVDCLVMEYVEGETVAAHLERSGAYGEKAAVQLVLQVASALEHAHGHGFVHRDVKPRNIIVAADGTAKLTDLGLARQVSDTQSATAEGGKAYGTPYYISPEQIRGRTDVDGRADIYGLGATLYHMATGQVPFDAATPSSVMHKHLLHELTPPRQVNPQLSRNLCDVMEVMMQKDRDLRYDSMSEVQKDLQSLLDGAAPELARRRLEIKAKVALQDTAIHPIDHRRLLPPMMYEPLFWVLLASVALNLFLVFALMLK